jgi:glycosyltransferase involved in cell wall biosynthesis
MKPDAPPVWKQALWMLRNPQSVQLVRNAHSSFGADAWLVHNVLPVGSLAIYSEGKRLGIPLIQYVHNFRPFSVNSYLWAANRVAPGGLSKNYWQEIRVGAWQNSRVKTAWLAFVLVMSHAFGLWRNIALWIAISDFMRDKFISAGIPAEKIHTLRHFWRPGKRCIPSAGMHYLFLGRLTEAKGITVLLEAWEILERELSSRTPRLLIGGDGPLRAYVQERASKLSSIRFAGQLSASAKAEALIEARAIVAPSISWEGLGLVVYEAYDYCRPVLVARSGGLPEIVDDSKTGLIHEPGNARQLAEHVLKLEQDSNNRAAMGELGRLWLEQNASENNWQQRFCEIVRPVVS